MAATTQVRLLVWTFSRRSSRSPLRPTKLQLSARRTSSATSGVVPCLLGPDMERALARAIRELPSRGKRRNLKLPWLLFKSACRHVQLVSRFAAAVANEAGHAQLRAAQSAEAAAGWSRSCASAARSASRSASAARSAFRGAALASRRAWDTLPQWHPWSSGYDVSLTR